MVKRLLALLLLLSFTPFILAQTPTQPEPRSGHDLVWDATLEMVLLVNGDHQTTDVPGKIWGWDGEGWTLVEDDAPPSRSLGGVAYDAAHNTLLVYGGSQSAEAEGYSDQAWIWDGKIWTEGAEVSPGARDHLGIVYDSAREQMVMFGGQFFPTRKIYSDTWLWDGGDSAWTQVATRGPGARYHFAIAFDSKREQALLFGGTTGSRDWNDLWAWDGEAWSTIDMGTGPSRRIGSRMAFDEEAGTMVLFGGLASEALNDTWLWDGETWTEYTSERAPSPRSHHAMAYDPIRKKVILFGGYGDANFGDTWEWDLTNGWVNKTPEE